MRYGNSGFTLPETLIATAILVSGLAGVAWVFTMSIGANLANRHRAAAALLAAEKLEEFELAPRNDPQWSNGGGLDPLSPAAGFSDVVVQSGDAYLRLWEIAGGNARSMSVAVYVQPNGGRKPPTELIRATAVAAPGF
jgi:prepilin-type N-terminal cleavage/methylation domain-containing protein